MNLGNTGRDFYYDFLKVKFIMAVIPQHASIPYINIM